MSNEWTETDLEHFRAKLRKLRADSEQTRAEIQKESLDLSGGGIDTEGDEGTDREFEDVDLDVLDVADKQARAAAAALERMDEGTYGRCLDCDGAIARSRLEAMPHAPLCLACQEQQESEAP